jgi:hypothetical protein
LLLKNLNGVSNKGIMMEKEIIPEMVEHTPAHVHIHLSESRPVLSSAAYNGGWIDAEHLFILKFVENFLGSKGPFEPLSDTFDNYCRQQGAGDYHGNDDPGPDDFFQECVSINTGRGNYRTGHRRAFQCPEIRRSCRSDLYYYVGLIYRTERNMC